MALPSIVREALARARSRIGTGRYLAGGGGLDPRAAVPDSSLGHRRGCDAAGFLAWCLGYPRRQIGFAGGWDWVNADSMIVESETKAAWFRPLAEPEVGAIAVYPSIDHDRDGHADRLGHAGLIVGRPASWSLDASAWAALRVIHCSPSIQRHHGYAVDETHAAAWAQRASFRGASHSRWRTRFLRYVRDA
jgi:hypothetical protein